MSGPIRAIPAVMITSAALMVSLTTARAHEVGVDSTYQPSKPASWWVTPAEIEALEVIGGSIPDGAGVAADPYLGGSYLAVTDGARTMFSTTVVPGDDQLLVAGHVGDMASSPQVCAAAQRLGLAFVLTGGDPQSSVPRPDPYAGLGAVTDDPSFPVVARAGPYALHAVPRCDAG